MSNVHVFENVGYICSSTSESIVLQKTLPSYNGFSDSNIECYVPYLIRDAKKQNYEIGVGKLNNGLSITRNKVIASSNDNHPITIKDGQFFIFANEYNFNTAFNNVVVKEEDFKVDNVRAVYIVDTKKSHISAQLPDPKTNPSLVVDFRNINNNIGRVEIIYGEKSIYTLEGNKFVSLASTGDDWVVLQGLSNTDSVRAMSADSNFSIQSDPGGDAGELQYKLNATDFDGANVFFGNDSTLLFGDSIESQANIVLSTTGNYNTVFNQQYTDSDFIIYGSGTGNNMIFGSDGGLGVNVPSYIAPPASGNVVFYGEEFSTGVSSSGIKNMFFTYDGRLGLNIPTGMEPQTLAHFVNYNCAEGLRIENRTTCNSANLTLYHRPPTLNIAPNTEISTISFASKNSNGSKSEYGRIMGRVLNYDSKNLEGSIVLAVSSGEHTLIQTLVSSPDQTIFSAGASLAEVNTNSVSFSSENIVFSGNAVSFLSLTGASGTVNIDNLNVDTATVNSLELSNLADTSILTIEDGVVVSASTGVPMSIIGAPSGRLLSTDANGVVVTDINITDLFQTNNDIIYSAYPKRTAEVCLSQIIFDADDLPSAEEFSVGDQIAVRYGDGTTVAYTTITGLSVNTAQKITVAFTADQLSPTAESNLLIWSITKGFILTLQPYVDTDIAGDNDGTSIVLSTRPGENTIFNEKQKPIGFAVYTDSETPGLSISPSGLSTTSSTIGVYRQYATESSIIPLQVIVDTNGAGASTQFNTANYDYASLGRWAGLLSDVGTNGLPSFYGTYDQNGNASEWTADNSAEHRSTDYRYVAGGSVLNSGVNFNALESYESTTAASGVGFRVASAYALKDSAYISGILGMKFVPINNPKNQSNSTEEIVLHDYDDDSYSVVSVNNLGRVPYSYRMSVNEVTNSQYAEFLNAVASGVDSLGLYNTDMDDSDLGGIERTGSGPFSYATKTNYGNKPVNFVSYLSALRFCNWLENGAPTGLDEDPSNITEYGAYTLDISVDGTYSITKNQFSNYYIPDINEWYKAAYFVPTSEVLGTANVVTINADFPEPSAVLTVGGNTYIGGDLTVSGLFSAQGLNIASAAGETLVEAYADDDPEVSIQGLNSLALVNSENGRLTIGPNPTLVIDADGPYDGSYRTGFAKDRVTIAADGPIKILSSEPVIFTGISVGTINVKAINVVDDDGNTQEFFTGPSGGILYKTTSAKAEAAEKFIYDQTEGALQLTTDGVAGLSPLYADALSYVKTYDDLVYNVDHVLCKTLLMTENRDGLQIGPDSPSLKGAILVHQGQGPLAFELNSYLEAEGITYDRYPKRLVYVDQNRRVSFVEPLEGIGGIASELPTVEELDEEYSFGDTVAIMHTGDFEVEYVKLAQSLIGPYDGPDELLITYPPLFTDSGGEIYSNICPAILPNAADGEGAVGFTGIMYSITKSSTLVNGLGYGLFTQDPVATSGFTCDDNEGVPNLPEVPFTFRPSSKNTLSTRPMLHTHFNYIGENIDFAVYGRTKFQYNRYYPDVHDPNPLDGQLPNGLTPVFRIDANVPNAVSGNATGIFYSGYTDAENTVPTGFELDQIGKVLINTNTPYVITSITKNEDIPPSGYGTLDFVADLSVNGYTYTSGLITDHIFLSGIHESTYIPGAALTVDVYGKIISINPDVPPGPPGPPRSLIATAGNGSVDLAWLAPVDNGNSTIVDYLIEYSNNNGVTWTEVSDTISRNTYQQVTGLVNDANYIFRVAAVNGIGKGQWSLPSNLVTPSSNFPGPVRDLTLTRQTIGDPGNEVDRITVSWIPPTSGGNSPITRYIIRYKPSTEDAYVEINVATDTISNGVFTHEINGISPEPQYTVQVLARNNYGDGVPVTQTIDGTDAPPEDPPPPPDQYDFGLLTFNGTCE